LFSSDGFEDIKPSETMSGSPGGEVSEKSGPIINDNPALQAYYNSLESRIGYRLVLGGTRHFGYYENGSDWPWPIGRALGRMEDKLFDALALPSGSQVLDAGCGIAAVATHMARKGLRITGIDVVDHHIAKARRRIASSGLDGQVTVQKMDYHHLESLQSDSFDGVYTMETFVHATNPEAVLAGFFRILRPGGHIALFEYDHSFETDESVADLARSMRQVNNYAAMPTNARSRPGFFREILEDAGFTDVVVRDYSENIKPMLWLFWILAAVPYILVRLLRLEKYFINTVAGATALAGHRHWRFVAISARKPGAELEGAKVK
jgi:sterol 24-C-methyltransferase